MSPYDNIPDELKRLPQWVCVWKDSKAPMRPDPYLPGSSTNPSTWASYEDALGAVEAGYYDNIGFVFHDNGLVGIDIDDGWDDGLLSTLAADVISVCHSYTERSRSGRGFHVILKGTLPFSGRNNRAGLEIYRDARYFIMTGQTRWFKDIETNQAAIDYVVETYFQDQETDEKGNPARIYTPKWSAPSDGKVPLRPKYPTIAEGGRNLCLTSLAGALHNVGYGPQEIYQEIAYANATACDPCLSDREVRSIVSSVTRYKR